MRRWLVVASMLVGFLGQGYVFTARLPRPVPIERLISSANGARVAWWLERSG